LLERAGQSDSPLEHGHGFGLRGVRRGCAVEEEQGFPAKTHASSSLCCSPTSSPSHPSLPRYIEGLPSSSFSVAAATTTTTRSLHSNSLVPSLVQRGGSDLRTSHQVRSFDHSPIDRSRYTRASLSLSLSLSIASNHGGTGAYVPEHQPRWQSRWSAWPSDISCLVRVSQADSVSYVLRPCRRADCSR